jgi:biopolymer transport protein ExbB
MTSIIHFIHGGGWVMYPLLLLSLMAIAVIIERLIAFNQYGFIPSGLLPSVIALVKSGELGEALNLCESSKGPLAACLSMVLRHRAQPAREVERLVEEVGQDYFIRLEKFLPILDTTTTISPLLGLLGTIVGMIGAFNAIASLQQHGNNDAVLSGVGEALYATATGLIIAVVCFAAYNYFSARLRAIIAETQQGATKLINTLIGSHREAHADNERKDDNKQPVLSEEIAGRLL